jgi:hypothetical protein
MINKKINIDFEEIESELAFFIDQQVYLPVKNELKDCGKTYSLGLRKEKLKRKIHEVIKNIKKETVDYWENKIIEARIELMKAKQFNNSHDETHKDRIHFSIADKILINLK